METKPVILAVDDTELNTDILVELLRDRYEVITALDGERAIEIANKKHVDLILLDIMMPEMDGYDVCQHLKSNQKTKDIPIIFITAKTDETSIEKAYDIGGIDYVTKPFRPKELLARVQRELAMQKLIDELKKSQEELKLLAITDSMTKLYNRRYFSEISMELFALAKRENRPLSLIMLDIDKFKTINDTYGHKVGDEAIIALGNLLRKAKRKSDVACRLGGEEFVLLLPNTAYKDAKKVAEKIRKRVEKSKIPYDEGKTLSFTISLGVAEVDFEHEDQIEPALKRADDALYEAKKSGRNRVC
ncbi:MAG: diguanylate cyclase response regulator [Hydrogenimonas sp.]|nr:MAG: diguanylate cyclase response regulator [Hydrogenimonas sp.]